MTPDFFACNGISWGRQHQDAHCVDSSLLKPIRAMFDVRMGNGRPRCRAHPQRVAAFAPTRSPSRSDRQGANDPASTCESEQIVDAIAKNGGNVTYVLYSDEGHGFARPENRIDFNARSERFLGSCLGGRFEPMEGDKIPGSTAVVKVVGK